MCPAAADKAVDVILCRHWRHGECQCPCTRSGLLLCVSHVPCVAAQLQSAASSPAAGGMWSRDSIGWRAAFAPGANEAALRTQAALALGVDGLPQVGRDPACEGEGRRVWVSGMAVSMGVSLNPHYAGHEPEAQAWHQSGRYPARGLLGAGYGSASALPCPAWTGCTAWCRVLRV